jgi:hypothetical protein
MKIILYIKIIILLFSVSASATLRNYIYDYVFVNVVLLGFFTFHEFFRYAILPPEVIN